MRLSVFTDEISPDVARAITLAARWGLRHVEVRGLAGGRFPQVGDAELAEVLPRACDWARAWGTDLVTCFGFRRSDSDTPPAQVTDTLAHMADVARSGGCRLVLENEHGCWGNTGLEAAQVARRVGPERLGLVWDPGNAARAGSSRPFPDEYEQLKDLVRHVHLKNYDPPSGEWSLMERGTVDWEGQLQALERDRYDGFLVLETHLRTLPSWLPGPDPGCTPLETNTRRNLEYVRRHGISGLPPA